MALGIEIIEEKKNVLVNRLEITFKLENKGKGTPNRLDIKNEVAALKTSDEKLTIVRDIETRFGTTSIFGLVHIYEDDETLKFYEPFHIRVRNQPKEKREEIHSARNKGVPYEHLFNAVGEKE